MSHSSRLPMKEMSLTKILPKPTQVGWDSDDISPSKSTAIVGDGVAFPKITMAQYPLDMGRPTNNKSESNALAVQFDADGKIKYDVLVRHGQRKDKIVYSKHTDILPAEITTDDPSLLMRPDEEEIQNNVRRTQAALEKLTNSKIAAAMPVHAASRRSLIIVYFKMRPKASSVFVHWFSS